MAAGIVASAEPDGYTLLTADIQQMAITPFLFSDLPFDVATDFSPISLMISMPLFMMVNPNGDYKDLQELASFSKSNPVMYATPGVGSIHHIAMESLRHAMDLEMTHIPYKGAAQVITASGSISKKFGDT